MLSSRQAVAFHFALAVDSSSDVVIQASLLQTAHHGLPFDKGEEGSRHQLCAWPVVFETGHTPVATQFKSII